MRLRFGADGDYRIMTAPFEDRDGWEMNCVPLGGSIYLELDDPPEKRSYR